MVKGRIATTEFRETETKFIIIRDETGEELVAGKKITARIDSENSVRIS